MSEGEVQEVIVEFYTPQEVQLDNVCIITLYKKSSTEISYKHKELVEKFKEDLFLSWLLSITSSKGYPIARAITKANGLTFEVLVLTIKPKYFINYPYIARVKHIYLVQNLKIVEKNVNIYDQKLEQATDLIQITEGKGNIQLTPLLDLSKEELYILNSPITMLNQSKACGLIIEIDKGVIFLRFDELPKSFPSSARAKNSTRKERRGRVVRKTGLRSSS